MTNSVEGLNHISIGTARWLTNKNGLDGTIVLAFGGGKFKAASYGADVRKCRQLGKLIDAIGDQIEAGSLDISEFERGL